MQQRGIQKQISRGTFLKTERAAAQEFSIQKLVHLWPLVTKELQTKIGAITRNSMEEKRDGSYTHRTMKTETTGKM